MNNESTNENAAREAGRISSTIVREYLEAGGAVSSFKTIWAERPDDRIHLLTVPHVDGTYLINNAGVMLCDATPERITEALEEGEVDEINRAFISEIAAC